MKVINVYYFAIISTWRKKWPFIWTNLNPLHPRLLCAKFCSDGSQEEDFLKFYYLAIISPWEKARPLICTNLNPLHLRMLCVIFGWNWPSGSPEEDEMWKVNRWTDRQTDRQTDKWMDEQMNRRPTGEQKGSGELKTKNNQGVFCISLNSGPSYILTPYIQTLQHPENFSLERNFLV